MTTTRTLCSEIQPQRECHIQCYCIYWPSVLGYTMPVCIDCPLLTMLACHSSARPASWSRCAHLSLTRPIHRYDHLRWVHGILDHAATMLRPWQWPTELQVNFYKHIINKFQTHRRYNMADYTGLTHYIQWGWGSNRTSSFLLKCKHFTAKLGYNRVQTRLLWFQVPLSGNFSWFI